MEISPLENLLSGIDSPNDLRKLHVYQLEQLAAEIREFIIDKCSANPGHFGASLGAVEIAVALHYVFNTPYDKLIWDVGHQAYAHKILTGRKNAFDSNRKLNGLSGFPKMEESEYDAFGVGHASTSISAGLGFAVSARMNGENRQTVAVIGDGSLTGGMAFEGLNNAGWENADMLVILNDNNIAIDPSVGALKKYLTHITSSSKYNKLKKNIWNILGEGSSIRWLLRHLGNVIKSAVVYESNFFESLGFRYFGPIDGHDVRTLTTMLTRLKTIRGPKLLHVVTQKGKGYEPAERNQTEWHAPGKFDRKTGKIRTTALDFSKPARYQDVFGETIIELAEQNPRITGITPAMATGCSLNRMMHRIPERTFDVGIAEAHAVTFAAGLAVAGWLPFCNIYSSFLQRAYDSVIHDVALQKLNMVLCIDRGGLVGEDGATHHGVFDLAYLRLVPNLIIAAPMNEIELRNMMYTAQLDNAGTFSIRYPRGVGAVPDWKRDFGKITVGKGRILHEGTDVAILSIGHPGNIVAQAIRAVEEKGISVMHCDMRFLKPIDEELLARAGRFKRVITVEDGTVTGGLGSAVAEFFAANNCNAQLTRLGVPDRFIQHGTIDELQSLCGFDVNGIVRTVVSGQ